MTNTNTNIDLHCSHGPVSSMPGSSHPFPTGSKCDTHEDRLAVARVQGETDSMGCEYLLACQECVDGFRKFDEEEFNTPRYCDWHRGEGLGVRPTRDYDEGSAGPLYNVCSECRNKRDEAAREELEELDEIGYNRAYGWI